MNQHTAKPFGEVALDVLTRVAVQMGGRRNLVTGEPMELTDDVAIGWSPFMRALDAAGFDARSRGATISVVRHGMLVAKGGRSELVRLEQIECGILLRALDRVAPYPWEIV